MSVLTRIPVSLPRLSLRYGYRREWIDDYKNSWIATVNGQLTEIDRADLESTGRNE